MPVDVLLPERANGKPALGFRQPASVRRHCGCCSDVARVALDAGARPFACRIAHAGADAREQEVEQGRVVIGRGAGAPHRGHLYADQA